MKSILIRVVVATALVLAGCAVGPSYQRPELTAPTRFNAQPPEATSNATPAPLEAWWRGFDDPVLLRVVERALAQNLDLEQARARILQSRALAKAAGAALAPQANLGVSAANEQQSLQSPIGEIGRNLPGYERSTDLYDVGASASWEIDLFGGLRRAHQAASAEARASQAEADAIRTSVAADAADAYLQVRAFQARIAVARRQERVELDLVDLLNRRTAQGVAADRELRLTRAELEGVRATIPPLTAALEAQLNRLDVLEGAQPGTWRSELAADAPIPSPPAIAIGKPTDLLRRRPDILASEQRLMAANARIGAAIADYYPKLSLSGLFGVESIDTAGLFTGDALQHQVSAGLRWRLFDFGRVDAEVAQARGREAEALAAYRASVLRASEDVENALTDLVQQEARGAALDRQIAELTVARGQAEQAYEGGVISLIEVRDADRDLLAASDQRVQAKANAARAAVATFRAIGGGWSMPEGSAQALSAKSMDKGRLTPRISAACEPPAGEERVQGIHITGASGSGVSTLGHALAERLGLAHLDTDSFYWLPSDPPFQNRRALNERLAMMEAAFAASRQGWVLSGSLDGWGDVFIPCFSAVVFVYTPPTLRMARLLARERRRYGEAIAPGGPMHAHHLEFVGWAEGYDESAQPGRSLARHEAWLSTLPCPVIRLDGTSEVGTLVEATLEALPAGA